jgi:ketosteroid isomerase-like protein
MLAVLGCIALGACHRAPDEQQVREAIAAAASSARGNDADGVLAVVSDDFVGNDGDLDRHGLKQMLALRAFRHDSTGVLVGPVSIERRGDRLIASFTLTLAGGKSGSLLPDQADVYEMTTAWRHEGRHWRCYSASWRHP